MNSIMSLTSTTPAISAAFLASLVEAVEAVTIVLAVATVRGWRSAGIGALAGLVLLALLVLVLGPLLEHVPLQPLQFVIGVLLFLFGTQWLRKAILRAARVIPLRDERLIFDRESGRLTRAARPTWRLDWIAVVASFKAVLLEGLEVVFIVLAIGSGQSLLGAASLGAVAACSLVVALMFAARGPLTRVPENLLKMVVGILLSAFGVFWVGKGIGVVWPGDDLAIIGIIGLFVLTALAAISRLRRSATRTPA
jgi:Ca2+/H+ antiporter, TMEM165/GDT1 family